MSTTHLITLTDSVSLTIMPPHGTDTTTWYVPGVLHTAVTVAPVSAAGVAPVRVHRYEPEGDPDAVNVTGSFTSTLSGPLMPTVGLPRVDITTLISHVPFSEPPDAVESEVHLLLRYIRLPFVSPAKVHVAAG